MAHRFSIRLLLAVAWFTLCGCYEVKAGVQSQVWYWSVAGVASLVAAVGVLWRRNWAKWLVYVLSGAIVVTWVYALAWSLRSGRFPYPTLEETVLGLVPGFVLLAATIWSVDTIRRSFRAPISQVPPSGKN
jgi:hypothetical protein